MLWLSRCRARRLEGLLFGLRLGHCLSRKLKTIKVQPRVQEWQSNSEAWWPWWRPTWPSLHLPMLWPGREASFQVCATLGHLALLRALLYIYMGSGRFPGPMELLLQQLVGVSKTRWRWFNLNKSMLLQPLIKKLEVLVVINQWTTYCINDNNDERWMVVLIDFYLTFCKN